MFNVLINKGYPEPLNRDIFGVWLLPQDNVSDSNGWDRFCLADFRLILLCLTQLEKTVTQLCLSSCYSLSSQQLPAAVCSSCNNTLLPEGL